LVASIPAGVRVEMPEQLTVVRTARERRTLVRVVDLRK
jgi:hypothetical protein